MAFGVSHKLQGSLGGVAGKQAGDPALQSKVLIPWVAVKGTLS